MSKYSSSWIILESEKELESLKQLHVQAQTVSLNIESQDWEQLHCTLAAMEKLAMELTGIEQELMIQIGSGPLNWEFFPPDERDTLRGIKRESSSLVDKIKMVENHNLKLLERVKIEAIRASRQIQQYQELIQTYLSSQNLIPKISQLAE